MTNEQVHKNRAKRSLLDYLFGIPLTILALYYVYCLILLIVSLITHGNEYIFLPFRSNPASSYLPYYVFPYDLVFTAISGITFTFYFWFFRSNLKILFASVLVFSLQFLRTMIFKMYFYHISFHEETYKRAMEINFVLFILFLFIAVDVLLKFRFLKISFILSLFSLYEVVLVSSVANYYNSLAYDFEYILEYMFKYFYMPLLVFFILFLFLIARSPKTDRSILGSMIETFKRIKTNKIL